MKELYEKLNRIQSSLIAPKGQTNSFGNYKYRSCEDILEVVKPLLKEEDLVLIISDEVVLVGDRYYVKATASVRSSDERTISVTALARESEDKKGMDSAQITGAASSYARKYALNGLFCIDDTKDADTRDNRTTSEPRKTSAPSEEPQQDQEAKTMTQIVSELAATKFPNPDEYKTWRIDNGLAENLKDTNDFELTKVLVKLKEIK